MTAHTTAYQPRRIGRVCINQQALFDWLGLDGAILLDAGIATRWPQPIIELFVEHKDMPDVPASGLIADVTLTHSVQYHEYHDKPVRTSPKRED